MKVSDLEWQQTIDSNLAVARFTLLGRRVHVYRHDGRIYNVRIYDDAPSDLTHVRAAFLSKTGSVYYTKWDLVQLQCFLAAPELYVKKSG